MAEKVHLFSPIFLPFLPSSETTTKKTATKTVANPTTSTLTQDVTSKTTTKTFKHCHEHYSECNDTGAKKQKVQTTLKRKSSSLTTSSSVKKSKVEGEIRNSTNSRLSISKFNKDHFTPSITALVEKLDSISNNIQAIKNHLMSYTMTFYYDIP